MQTPIGRETSTLIINNEFELLQDMEDNEEQRPNLKETKNRETNTTQPIGKGESRGHTPISLLINNLLT